MIRVKLSTIVSANKSSKKIKIQMNGGIIIKKSLTDPVKDRTLITGAWMTTIVPGSYKDWKSNIDHILHHIHWWHSL